MHSRTCTAAAVLLATLGLPFLLTARSGDEPKEKADSARYAGPSDKGFLLPNGWTLTPAGSQVALTDLPLNILPLADNRHALVATSGFNTHNLSLVDLVDKKIVNEASVRQSWFGLAADEKAGKVWWSGGGSDMIHAFDLKDGTLTQTNKPADEPAAKGKAKGKAKGAEKHFRSGLTLDKAGKVLYTLDIDTGTIAATSLDPRAEQKPLTAKVGNRPYDVVFGRDGRQIFVTDWAARMLLVLNPADLRVMSKIPVGEHPNQIAVHPKDDRIFVANASSNSVSVIDTLRGVVIETIATPLFPLSPEGSTPDALALAPDGETLYVANADNNCVAVIDVKTPSRSQVKGFIPTGWYPTSVAVTPDGKNLLVGVGKGNQTLPNPPTEANRKHVAEVIDKEKIDLPADVRKELMRFPYIGTTLSGSLSIVPIPDQNKLAEYTATVYRNCPYSDKLLTQSPTDLKTAVPSKVGEPSPIKYVIYIIKENRTYDQVFGDMPKGNGDPALTLFGEKVTPNHHKLAREYVQLDNLYCNGHVSADGHPWSTMAYNTDYIARNWALTYSRRAGVEDDDDDNLAKAPSGYLWDACAARGSRIAAMANMASG